MSVHWGMGLEGSDDFGLECQVVCKVDTPLRIGSRSSIQIKETGLDSTWLAREDAMICVDVYIELVNNALDKTGDPDDPMRQWQDEEQMTDLKTPFPEHIIHVE